MGILEALIYAMVIFVAIFSVLAVIASLIKVVTYFTEILTSRYKK